MSESSNKQSGQAVSHPDTHLMKHLLITPCALAATLLMGAAPVRADYLRDDDRDGHVNIERTHRDKHHHHDRWRHRHGHYYRPWYRIGPSYHSTVVVRSSPRYHYSLEASVQRELARRGYYRGPIDGDIGPGSRAAIRSYQYRHGLPVTGRIDRRLLRSLGL
jgi:hypothetical protein